MLYRKCPLSNYFDVDANQCTTSKPPSCRSDWSDETDIPVADGQCDRSDRKLANVFDCRSYYECREIGMVHSVCRYGTYFDSTSTECSLVEKPTSCLTDWSARKPLIIAPTEKPVDRIPLFPLVTPAIDRYSLCRDHPDGYTYKTQDDQCTTYEVCWHGVSHSGRCPIGFSYNRAASTCDNRDNHYCKSSELGPPTSPVFPRRRSKNTRPHTG